MLSRSGLELNSVSVESEVFRVSQTSLIYIKQNKIGFLKANGRPSALSCRGAHQTRFIDAAADGISAGHIYGLAEDGFVYVFKTSNLLQ